MIILEVKFEEHIDGVTEERADYGSVDTAAIGDSICSWRNLGKVNLIHK